MKACYDKEPIEVTKGKEEGGKKADGERSIVFPMKEVHIKLIHMTA